ncbi:endoplasmic reticulum mannosyl-oligosaccharide 1,2-alpha-mannosidase [Thelonectria olida]|uniref:alpha-1,2-Mannosidase n=1 Tax=Thelonectria olida TaxID=1576542 RepID=A0A9P8WHE2_9HYPO|nr:endoplasmic reticulum mannosyl-oligosaccharide 1,2-alpha-mannosidase [Thelonectria olida]
MNKNVPNAAPLVKSSFDWSKVKFAHPGPPASTPLPSARLEVFPRIQHEFEPETKDAAAARDWANYRKFAWNKDALNPVSGTWRDQFCGWAATLVDSLDTLWIMGMREEFDEAVATVAAIDFGQSTTARVNIFETNIRYLGGLLSAYDLSKREVLLAKAIELGDMLYAGFNTENRMPVDFIEFEQAKTGQGLKVEDWVVLAAPGSLSLEMTRLSQVTGDMKYHDAITSVMEVFHQQQNHTRIPGLWPMWISMKTMDVSARDEFTIAGSADSTYEYLPKMYALLGGRDDMYKNMSTAFMDAAGEYLFFRPMLPDEKDILFPGNVVVNDKNVATFDAESEHLGCFIGGTIALGGQLFGSADDIETGVKLAKGCAYAYAAFPTGMMPERFNSVPCNPPRATVCRWNVEKYILDSHKRKEYEQNLPKGFTTAKDARYILRPEAIESLFVTYRITGEKELQDMAWDMFSAIAKGTAAEHGHASVVDVTSKDKVLAKEDYMESFWLAETLKYFYLIFSPPDLISLDDYVLNTEAHPFRLPQHSTTHKKTYV